MIIGLWLATIDTRTARARERGMISHAELRFARSGFLM
jgi:hypothetical protein